jgi:hypothetical protein
MKMDLIVKTPNAGTVCILADHSHKVGVPLRHYADAANGSGSLSVRRGIYRTRQWSTRR